MSMTGRNRRFVGGGLGGGELNHPSSHSTKKWIGKIKATSRRQNKRLSLKGRQDMM